jgi:hypothetical protein
MRHGYLASLEQLLETPQVLTRLHEGIAMPELRHPLAYGPHGSLAGNSRRDFRAAAGGRVTKLDMSLMGYVGACMAPPRDEFIGDGLCDERGRVRVVDGGVPVPFAPAEIFEMAHVMHEAPKLVAVAPKTVHLGPGPVDGHRAPRNGHRCGRARRIARMPQGERRFIDGRFVDRFAHEISPSGFDEPTVKGTWRMSYAAARCRRMWPMQRIRLVSLRLSAFVVDCRPAHAARQSRSDQRTRGPAVSRS